MNNIKPIIFLIPVIVLFFVSAIYFYLLKKATNRKAFENFIFIMSILAFLVNFAWELIQIPLYKNPVYDINHIAFCALASLADVLMVLLLCFSIAIFVKYPFWLKPLKIHQVVILAFIGGAVAAFSERLHLSWGSWAYSDSMPIIPFIHAGISPVLQFMLLPSLIYYLTFSRLKISKLK